MASIWVTDGKPLLVTKSTRAVLTSKVSLPAPPVTLLSAASNTKVSP